MCRDLAPLGGCQRRIVMNDVVQRRMDLSDIVEECHALDAADSVVIEHRFFTEHDRVGGDATDMRPGLRVIGVDGVEESLQCASGQPFHGSADHPLTSEEDSAGGADGEREGGDARHARILAQETPHRVRRGLPVGYVERMQDVARVTTKGARRWEAGHPWIFRSDVERRPSDTPGVVAVEDHRGKPLGSALWSPQSEISLRLLDRDPRVTIDASWWRSRIGAAISRRDSLQPRANAYRLVHGEGDGLPSLVCDRYDRWLVVQLLSAGLEQVRSTIVEALVERCTPDGILARNDASVRVREGLAREMVLLSGNVPREIEVVENEVRFIAAPWDGQKTGAFLDQRENRALVGTVARGKALDCFSYHGSFALHLARGASRVTSLDTSAAALARGAENARRNGLTNIEFVEADAFDYLRAAERRGDRYDTIVVDPPAFAKSRQALAGAVRGYKEINLRAMRLLAPGGLLFTASCSYHLTRPLFLEMLEAAAADSGRRVALRELRGQPLDHPEILTIPETGYLKGALVEALP